MNPEQLWTNAAGPDGYGPGDGHDHRWERRSSHSTSEGVVTYQGCHCGAHRVLRASIGLSRLGPVGLHPAWAN